MAKTSSLSLVIDAPVAQAAGPPHAVHPTAKSCRDFLQKVLDVGHRAVFSPAVSAEWNEHQSGFARHWRTSMFARKKIERIANQEDRPLRSQISESSKPERDRVAMLKDIHLIEAARAADSRIASLDDKARALFREASSMVKEIRSVCWVNPTNPAEDPLSWLESGAAADRSRQTGHRSGTR